MVPDARSYGRSLLWAPDGPVLPVKSGPPNHASSCTVTSSACAVRAASWARCDGPPLSALALFKLLTKPQSAGLEVLHQSFPPTARKQQGPVCVCVCRTGYAAPVPPVEGPQAAKSASSEVLHQADVGSAAACAEARRSARRSPPWPTGLACPTRTSPGVFPASWSPLRTLRCASRLIRSPRWRSSSWRLRPAGSGLDVLSASPLWSRTLAPTDARSCGHPLVYCQCGSRRSLLRTLAPAGTF
jgi:hypothetical protein